MPKRMTVKVYEKEYSTKKGEKRSSLYLVTYNPFASNPKDKRIWESLNLRLTGNRRQDREIWKQAEIVRSKRELSMLSGEYDLVDHARSRMSLIDYSEELSKIKNSQGHLFKALRYIREYSKGIMLSQVTSSWVESFQHYLLHDTGLGQTTASHYSGALRQVLRRAERDRLILSDPSKGIKGISAPEVEKVYLTIKELEILSKTPIGGELGNMVKWAFLFGCYTGLRKSDIANLQWKNLDLERNELLLRQAKTKRFVGMPLHKTAYEIVKDGQIHQKEDFVFPLLAGNKTNTNQYLWKWTAEAGIEKKIGWHTARHTFASLTYQYNEDIYTVSKLLGHSKLGQSATYTKLSDPQKRKAIESLPGIEIRREA